MKLKGFRGITRHAVSVFENQIALSISVQVKSNSSIDNSLYNKRISRRWDPCHRTPERGLILSQFSIC